jgi:DNA invertase Pin-like site-specific DNA recombinase
MSTFFLYARKSTDEPDRQILSIEAQLAELREFAEREHLNVVQTFIESQTAKEPGRPVFNEMLSLIEKGCAQGMWWILGAFGKFFMILNQIRIFRGRI